MLSELWNFSAAEYSSFSVGGVDFHISVGETQAMLCSDIPVLLPVVEKSYRLYILAFFFICLINYHVAMANNNT